MRLEFYFDFSCPFAYLGAVEIDAIARRTGAELSWRPMLLGGLLRALGAEHGLAAEPRAKRQDSLADMHRWAEVRGVPLRIPPDHPQKTVRALRTLLAVDQSLWPALVRELYRSYWELGEPIEDTDTLRRALAAVGTSGDAAERTLARAEASAVKEELRRRTDEAIERGVFGAPTVFVGEQMFWGQDRLGLVEAAARGWRPGAGRPSGEVVPGRPTGPAAPGVPPATVEFWFDFSSPFSYLAAVQVEAMAARVGARLEWRPILLGALFKELGGPIVPILAMSEPKRRYMGRDLENWAHALAVPFTWSSHFPIKTVTALRLALLSGERIGEVSMALFRAAWAEDRNIDDAEVLSDLLGRLGLDAGALLAGTREPEIKQRLTELTGEAARRGIFGAPTFIVKRGEGERKFWGQDRIGLVERAAAGIEPPTS